MEKEKIFIAPNGKMYKHMRFVQAYMEIDGVDVTELWCDAYKLNYEKGDEVLFPADLCPFPVVEHIEKWKDFIEKGGGFRLDFSYNLK